MRRAAPLLLLVIIMAAGCAAPGMDDGSAAGGTAGEGIAFLPPVVLGKGGPEPVVVIAPEGDRVYVAAQDATGGSPHVWISRDGGATFIERRPSAQGGGEVDLAAGPDGMVYLTQLGPRGNIVSVSRDHGETWQTSPIGTQTQYFDREWLAVDAQERVYMVAREFGVNAAAGIARSDDKGLTFQPKGNAWSTFDEPGQANGNLIAAKGALHLAYICRDGEGVCVSTSRDAGQSWQQTLVASRAASVGNVYPNIAATAQGLVVSWSDATSGALGVYTSFSRDGASWTPPTRVAGGTAAGTATLPWVAARGPVTWLVHLSADAPLSGTDGPETANVAWVARAVPLDAQGRATGEPVSVLDEPVHRGPISPPVGQTQGGTRDRNFGDFFTATVDFDGRLIVAVSQDDGSPETVRDLVVRERA